jgi:hypothetical protein
MKYMLIMHVESAATAEAAAGIEFDDMLEMMGRYNDAMTEAGVFVTAEGLAPGEEGAVLDFAQNPPLVTDGPFAEGHELFNGYWILDTATREEAVQWAAKAPLGPGVKLELRRIHSLSEFDEQLATTDNEYVKTHVLNQKGN